MSVDFSDIFYSFCLRAIRDRGAKVTVSQLYDASYGITSQVIFDLFDEGFIKLAPEPMGKSFLRRVDLNSIAELTEKGATTLDKGFV